MFERHTIEVHDTWRVNIFESPYYGYGYFCLCCYLGQLSKAPMNCFSAASLGSLLLAWARSFLPLPDDSLFSRNDGEEPAKETSASSNFLHPQSQRIPCCTPPSLYGGIRSLKCTLPMCLLVYVKRVFLQMVPVNLLLPNRLDRRVTPPFFQNHSLPEFKLGPHHVY